MAEIKKSDAPKPKAPNPSKVKGTGSSGEKGKVKTPAPGKVKGC